MRRFIKTFVSLLLIVTLQLVSVAGSIAVYAADLSHTYNFITGVELTDLEGNPLGENVAKDSGLRLTYHYAISNKDEVKDGDTFTLTIPEQIKIDAPGEFEIRDGENNLLGTGTIGTDGTLVITFTNYAETYSNLSGSFWFELCFDESKIGLDDPTSIEFELGGTTPPYEIEVDFEQPAPLPTSIEKEGSYTYNEETGNTEITWRVTVNPENVAVRDAQIVDVIANGLDFIPGSVTINGSPASESDYTYDDDSGTLIYDFPELIATQQIVTFKTTVKDSQFTTGDSHGTVLHESNTATMNHDDTFDISNEATVDVPVEFIDKTGVFNPDTLQIDWTIEVNKNGVSIPDAVVTDTLPDGLTLDTDSVQIDGVSSSDFTYNHPDITFTLGAISEKHTIKFSTDVEDDAFNSNTSKIYDNTAAMTGTGVPGNAESGDSEGVPTNIIRKEGVSYNPATGEITWKITVNENKISIQNPIVTDDIMPGQEHVAGSATIDNGASADGFSYTPAAEGDESKTGTLTYTFGATISDTYIIEFRTKVTDPGVYAGNSNTTYKNDASITGDNIPESKSEGTQGVDSQVIKKTGTGYDYTTRNITWNIVVNRNEMPLENAILRDDIPKGMEYVAGSATIDNGASADKFSYTPAVEDDPDKTGTLTYTFPALIDETYTITFQTHITDLSIFQTNGDKTIRNTASLEHGLVPGGVTNEGTQTIRNTVISKTGSYTSGKKYIDWTVNINTNEIPLIDAAITDQLQEGLALDTGSVKLFHQSIDAGGNLILGEEIGLTGDNIQYDLATRMFTFHLPTPASGGYQLTFRTNVTDKTKSPFKNEATFNGTGKLNQGSSESIPVSWSGSGSTGDGEVGSITVHKVDAENHDQMLEGAQFDLIDKYGNVIQQATSAADGSALFEMLRFDIPYTVRETAAPTGYNISKTEYTFTIAGSDDVKDISYLYENARIYGAIRFGKLGVDGPLAGAEFTLYDEDGYSVATTLSKQNGEVLFEHVPYGDYTIRETNPPEGYLPTSIVLTASVREDGVTVTAAPASVSNQIIMGNIQLKKTGEDGVTPLQNATFALYSETDTNFANPMAISTTGEDGIAFFENVPYGSYVAKETIPPQGYVLSTEQMMVDVNENARTYDLGTFPNTLIRGNIEILKTNIVNDPLEGAKFALYDTADNLVAEAVSGSDGIARFTDIAFGHYTIREIEAPAEYVKSDEIFESDITSDGVVLQYTVVNERSNEYPWGTVQVKKTGDDGITPLQNATFALYMENDTDFSNPIATSITGEDGIALFNNIPVGIYFVKETVAPEGYLISNTALRVTVGENPEAYSAGTCVNQWIRGGIEILKTNIKSEPLQGAKFALYDLADNLIAQAETGSDGKAKFNDIPYGRYYIVETEAPYMYLVNDTRIEADIRIQDTVLQFTVINERSTEYPWKNDIPRTGDSIFPMVWLLAGSSLLLTAVLLLGKRKKRGK